MTDINKEIKTVCSFYASDWHLVTMLLPNIDKEINKGVKITTILEKDLTDKMETLLSKVKLKRKQQILNIGWRKEDIIVDNIKNKIKGNECVIINGSEEYIEKVHQIIEKYLDGQKIIDCYDINECEQKVKEILDKHESILNTSGEKSKEEYVTTIKMAN